MNEFTISALSEINKNLKVLCDSILLPRLTSGQIHNLSAGVKALMLERLQIENGKHWTQIDDNHQDSGLSKLVERELKRPVISL